MRRDPTCPACGTRTLTELVDYDQFCAGPVTAAAASDAVPEITPRALAARLAAGDDIDLLDVREPHEWAISRIDGARLVPLGTLGEAIPALDRTREIFVHCRSGARSARAVRQLRDAGFERVSNVAGGILRWGEEVGDGASAV